MGSRAISSVDARYAAMIQVVRNAGHDEQLALLSLHPQLAGKEAVDGTLTISPQVEVEPAVAGLNGCGKEELTRLRALNRVYFENSGSSVCTAVMKRDRAEILIAS
jgi:2-oxo-4-hydroxy-4-carboxy-5-ureidoimidazoline decarboxylase